MDKHELRKEIRTLKKLHSREELDEMSEIIMQKLENNADFQKAQIVMLYCSLPDEVQTMNFIEKWRKQKQIILPTVIGDDIIPVQLDENTTFATGDFNIQEPQNNPYKGSFDLIIVPGMAFDRNGNRLGRGKGFYDRFLCQHKDVKKIGICYEFQIVDEVPTEPTDIVMDEIIF